MEILFLFFLFEKKKKIGTNSPLERPKNYNLRDVDYGFYLWRKLFYGGFNARSQGHLVDAATGARAFESDFYVFFVLDRNERDVAAVAV